MKTKNYKLEDVARVLLVARFPFIYKPGHIWAFTSRFAFTARYDESQLIIYDANDTRYTFEEFKAKIKSL